MTDVSAVKMQFNFSVNLKEDCILVIFTWKTNGTIALVTGGIWAHRTSNNVGQAFYGVTWKEISKLVIVTILWAIWPVRKEVYWLAMADISK
jgi:hypothetical protein